MRFHISNYFPPFGRHAHVKAELCNFTVPHCHLISRLCSLINTWIHIALQKNRAAELSLSYRWCKPHDPSRT